ncbi:MAG: hypothetical protein RL477_1188 [Pseudomonadota bacterium]|jgi:tripartite-type tricarboxylate transporter receptor subunit TctC
MSGSLHRLLAVVFLVSICLPGRAEAQTAVADFYKGKSVSLLIGYPPGGGYDVYGRAVGRHIGRLIPGQPTIVIKNMPGAGSLKAANYIYNVAPKDGSLFGIVAGGIIIDSLIGGTKTEFDGRKFTWLGSANESTSACYAWHATGFKTLKDVMEKEFVVGAVSGGSSTYVWPLAMNNILGTKFKIVGGYPGTNDIVLAVERGEVQGLCGLFLSSIKPMRPTWLPEKKVNVLVQEATARHPDIPDVPTVLEYAKNADDRAALNLIFGWQVMGRPFIAPPGVPEDRAAALRASFDATMKDKAFLADADKTRIEIIPRTAAQVHAFLDEAWKTPKPVIERVYKVMGRDKPSKKTQ